MKVLIDVPIEPEVLARLQESGRHAFDAVVPPAEVERALPAERIHDAEGPVRVAADPAAEVLRGAEDSRVIRVF